MIRLTQAGPSIRLGSTLCDACPQGSVGCCVSPPDLGWADIGRIVSRGDGGFVLEQIRAGNLSPRPGGLAVRRVRRRESAELPRRLKCVYHGREGCTIAAERRPSTCNWFLCADAFADAGEARGDPIAVRARALHAALVDRQVRHDRALAARIAEVWPEGPAWDAGFLDWLGAELSALALGESTPLEVALPA